MFFRYAGTNIEPVPVGSLYGGRYMLSAQTPGRQHIHPIALVVDVVRRKGEKFRVRYSGRVNGRAFMQGLWYGRL